jgi:hypothetical protein
MSTKTNFKRVALVAVASLGLGVLTSIAPANAAATLAGQFVFSSTASASNYGVLSVDTAGTTAEALVNGKITIADNVTIDAGDNTDVIKLKITQGSAAFTFAEFTTASTDQAAATSADTQSVTFTASADANATGGYAAAYLMPTATGKVVIQYQSIDTSAGTTTVVDTLTIYVVATAAESSSDVLSVSDSYFSRVATATGTVATNVDAATASVANGSCAYIAFDLMDGYGENVSIGAIVATSSSTGASVTFNLAAAAATSTATAVMADAGSADYVAVCQAKANTAVTTTVSVSYNGTTVGSRSVVIVGQLAKLAVTESAATGLAVAPRSSSSGTHFYVLGYDAAGNRVATSGTPAVDSAGLTTVVSNVTVSGVLAITDSPGKSGYFSCSATTSGSSDVRVKHVDSLGTTVYSNTFKAQCGGTSAYSVKASLDKASYVPGDVATLTVTATDSQGKAVADTTTTGAGYSVAGSNMTAVTAPTTADTFTWGTKTYKFIVGSTEGSYAMAVSAPAYAAYGVTDQTVAYKISTGSTAVSNADVLKAIVSLIASINKQIAALQKALLKK